MATIHLDCKGLFCPMPIVEIARKFQKMNVGDILEVEADDPAFKPDVEAWVECMGHQLVRISEDGVIVAVLKKLS